MSYQVIARKWRPQTFNDLVGQGHVTETLRNAILNNRVAHAYIFSGARGVGKTTAARILAKALNCIHGPTAEPCGICDSCKEIAAGTSLDVIEIDAASNRGIDQIRELREMVRYAPAAARSKVVILDEAHMLTGEASNALLKTLEEPPDRVIFVMATTEPENLADTIRSRSQHFHFRALTFAEITGRLREIAAKEDLNIEAGALAVIARMAEGSLRDALSLLEQARAFCGDTIPDKDVRELLGVVPEDALEELVNAIASGSADRALGLVHTFQKEGRNLQHFCREAIRHMRNLLIARVCGPDSDLIAATPDQRPALHRAAAQFSEEDLTRFFQILLQTDDDLRRRPDPRVHLEMGLLRMINASRLAPLEELLAEMRSGTPAGSAVAGSSRATAAAASLPALRREAAAVPASLPPAIAPGLPARETIAPPTARSQEPPSREELPVQQQPRNREPQIAAPQAQQVSGITAAQVAEIKQAIHAQQKFLGELLEHGTRWELDGAELRIYFPPDKRAFAEMLEGRDPLEKLRIASGKVLGRAVRVCAKLEAVAAAAASASRAGSATHELRAQFERDPMVKSMLQRFGGKIAEVKHRPEET
ncbi:MAG TPA: DNA polymerase III subunit gamma/tau [Candidatus Acidoferrum sp.]|nr:DNA polymerase III subunit gamma/tau [Candidatus Acidoferrum sp.]